MRLDRSLLQPGTTYHVVQRGFDRCPIFRDDRDRQAFLWRLGRAVLRHGWQVIAYCLMDNHIHIVLRDRHANLPDGLRDLFGGYARHFNSRYSRCGHLYQGRYRAFIVAHDEYLVDVVRYVLLNPVKAGIVKDPGDWPWSSFNTSVGRCAAPDWMDLAVVLSPFADNPALLAEFVRTGATEPEVHWNRIGRLKL